MGELVEAGSAAAVGLEAVIHAEQALGRLVVLIAETKGQNATCAAAVAVAATVEALAVRIRWQVVRSSELDWSMEC